MNQIIENSLIAGCLLVLIVLPFILIGRHLKKKRTEGMIGRLKDAAGTFGVTLSRYGIINNAILGWDSAQRRLLFALDEERPENVDLNEVSGCYTLKRMNGRDVRSVSLQLVDGNDRLLHSISFYRQFTDSELTLNKALAHSAEWEALIKNAIKKDNTGPLSNSRHRP